mmetsp:Transcript_247/g.491  ORF Transcript_247/g.491 Transcript_247/m.491 type:complete len:386 (-) Transcript_247:949-2106(-)
MAVSSGMDWFEVDLGNALCLEQRCHPLDDALPLDAKLKLAVCIDGCHLVKLVVRDRREDGVHDFKDCFALVHELHAKVDELAGILAEDVDAQNNTIHLVENQLEHSLGSKHPPADGVLVAGEPLVRELVPGRHRLRQRHPKVGDLRARPNSNGIAEGAARERVGVDAHRLCAVAFALERRAGLGEHRLPEHVVDSPESLLHPRAREQRGAEHIARCVDEGDARLQPRIHRHRGGAFVQPHASLLEAKPLCVWLPPKRDKQGVHGRQAALLAVLADRDHNGAAGALGSLDLLYGCARHHADAAVLKVLDEHPGHVRVEPFAHEAFHRVAADEDRHRGRQPNEDLCVLERDDASPLDHDALWEEGEPVDCVRVEDALQPRQAGGDHR